MIWCVKANQLGLHYSCLLADSIAGCVTSVWENSFTSKEFVLDFDFDGYRRHLVKNEKKRKNICPSAPCLFIRLCFNSYAAVYLAAGVENLLEEIMMQCMPPDQETLLTASVLENAIANNGDLWGLLQPYAHLNAGRTATGNCPVCWTIL